MTKKQLEERKRMRQKSDASFAIYNEDGTIYAEMFEGKWIKKPKELKEKKEK